MMITKPKTNICQNCHIRPILARGRCHTCYIYLHRTGRERPLHLLQKYCSNCGQPVLARGLCRACYLYQRIHGRRRPAYLATPEIAVCRNPHCLKPLRFDPRSKNGYCQTCYQYLWRTGRNRPRRLTGGPCTWCECGQPATRQYAVKITAHGRAKAPVVLDLCEDCYALETQSSLISPRRKNDQSHRHNHRQP